jgi:siroheme synthase (precorrin-2 oxidase/ferrochelatase)
MTVLGLIWGFLSSGGWIPVAGAAVFGWLQIRRRGDVKAGEAKALSKILETDNAAIDHSQAAVAVVAATPDAELDRLLDQQAADKHRLVPRHGKPRD